MNGTNGKNRNKKGQFIKGHAFNLGKKGNYGKFERTDEYRAKLSEAGKKRIFSDVTKAKISKALRGKRTSPRTEFKEGHQPYYWKGGVSFLNVWIRHLFAPNFRKSVFERDNYTCQKCGAKSGCGKTVVLNAHHIKPFSKILDEFIQNYSQFSPTEDKITLIKLANDYKPFNDINNGITLCCKCHLGGGYHGKHQQSQ